MTRMAQRQVWAVVAVFAALIAGLVLLLFGGGRWHWADTRLQRDLYSAPRR